MQIAIMSFKLLQAWYVLAFFLNVASETCETNRDDLSFRPSALCHLNELLEGLNYCFYSFVIIVFRPLHFTFSFNEGVNVTYGK